MSGTLVRSRTAWIWLAVVLAAFLAVNLRWIVLYRLGQPYDIDEAGYLTFALMDYRGFADGGWLGWLRAIEAPSPYGPVAMVAASVLFMVFGVHAALGFAVVLASGLVVIAGGFLIGRRLGGDAVAVASAVLLATNPSIINGARTFNFGLPVTAIAVLALWSLLKSERFQRGGWSIAFGVFVGLLPLTRTMTIAFLPAYALAALIAALTAANRRRALGWMVASGVAGIATMATWLVPSGIEVYRYLVQYGYGNRATYYGSAGANLVESVLVLVRYVISFIYLPAALVIVVGWLLLGVAGLRHAAGSGLRNAARALLYSERLPLLIITGEGLAALMSSQNKGSFFVSPLLPAMVVLAVCGWFDVLRGRTGRCVAAGVTALAALVPLVTMTDLSSRFAARTSVDIPGVGWVDAWDGAGALQIYERGAGYHSGNPAMPVPPETGRAWIPAMKALLEQLRAAGAETHPTVFGARGYFLNTNLVNFVQGYDGGKVLWLMQITPEVIGRTEADNFKYLTEGQAKIACILLTGSGAVGEMQPSIDTDAVVAAARRAGFAETGSTVAMPDGREVTVWRRRGGAC